MGGSRNDPRRIRCGCFLPDLTGLAKTTSARLPRRIWRGERENARPAIRHAGLDPAPAFLASKEAGPDRVRSDERNQRGPCMLRLSDGMCTVRPSRRSEEHTSELQSPMRYVIAGFCLKKKK